MRFFFFIRSFCFDSWFVRFSAIIQMYILFTLLTFIFRQSNCCVFFYCCCLTVCLPKTIHCIWTTKKKEFNNNKCDNTIYTWSKLNFYTFYKRMTAAHLPRLNFLHSNDSFFFVFDSTLLSIETFLACQFLYAIVAQKEK